MSGEVEVRRGVADSELNFESEKGISVKSKRWNEISEGGAADVRHRRL